MKIVKLIKGFYIVLFVILSLQSCEKKNKNTTIIPPVSEEKTEKEIVQQEYRNPDFDFLEKYPFKTIPLVDSTNFDTFKMKNQLTEKQVQFLKLKNILSDTFEETEEFTINYRLQLSENFHTIVISYFHGEMELYSMLINYDLNYNIIDYKIIASDEIAESAFRTTSEITKNNLIIKDINYYQESPEVTIITYKLTKTGTIEIKR